MTTSLCKAAQAAEDTFYTAINAGKSSAEAMSGAILAALPHLGKPIGVMTIGSIDRLRSGLTTHEPVGTSDAWKAAIPPLGACVDYSATVPVFLAPPAPALPEGWKADEADFAKSIEHVIEQESLGGAACGWQPCSGCHETFEGHSVGDYPVSPTFGCEVGSGCHECGGLGVVWYHYDAKALADMERDAREWACTTAAPEPPASVSESPNSLVADEGYAEIGREIVSIIGREVNDPDSPLHGWAPAETYGEIITDLIGMIDEAKAATASGPVKPQIFEALKAASMYLDGQPTGQGIKHFVDAALAAAEEVTKP